MRVLCLSALGNGGKILHPAHVGWATTELVKVEASVPAKTP